MIQFPATAGNTHLQPIRRSTSHSGEPLLQNFVVMGSQLQNDNPWPMTMLSHVGARLRVARLVLSYGVGGSEIGQRQIDTWRRSL